jgi:pimeloyl-ACP methyl ester carboxylesterase
MASNQPYQYVYLHGFASSPQSGKAQFLQKQFASLGIALQVPDLNLPSFKAMTLTQILTFLMETYGEAPLRVMGSSLGGFLSLLWAARQPAVERLLLLAPALGFADRLAQSMGTAALEQWRQQGTFAFHHYGLGGLADLGYEFFRDAQGYSELELRRSLPILILHGTRDDVVPISLSEDFAAARSDSVRLVSADADHRLADQDPWLWEYTRSFMAP